MLSCGRKLLFFSQRNEKNTLLTFRCLSNLYIFLIKFLNFFFEFSSCNFLLYLSFINLCTAQKIPVDCDFSDFINISRVFSKK